MSAEPSDSQLLGLLMAADEEGFAAGEDVRRRAGWTTVQRVMARLGYSSYVVGGSARPPVLVRIDGLVKQFYRREDWQVGGMHLGTFMYRDTFARVSVPIAFGTVAINPLNHVELPVPQLRRLGREPFYLHQYYDQFTDLFDFGWGLDDLGKARPIVTAAKTYFGLAHFQIQAAAAIVTGAYDFRGAVQSALLGAELSMKAGLAAHGVEEKELKSKALGHDLKALAERLQPFEPKLDIERVLRVVQAFPAYVPNRYAAEQPDRRQVGTIVMGAQYVAAEVMRRFSGRDFRSCGHPPLARTYPI